MHYYNFNIGDYRRDTSHLTLLEHGIYRQLIDTYYLNDGILPANIPDIMRTHSIRNADEMQAFENVLKDFFIIENDVLIHKGCDKILSAYQSKSDKAKASALARWGKNTNAMRTHSDGNANGMLTNNHKPITNKEKKSIKPDDVSDAIWNEWIAMRKTKKASIGELVLSSYRKEASKINWTLEKVLQECVVRNWQGFKADWIDKQSVQSVKQDWI